MFSRLSFYRYVRTQDPQVVKAKIDSLTLCSSSSSDIFRWLASVSSLLPLHSQSDTLCLALKCTFAFGVTSHTFSLFILFICGDGYQPPPPTTTRHAYTKSLTQTQHKTKKYFHKNPGSAWRYKHSKLVLPCFSLRFFFSFSFCLVLFYLV